MFSTDPGKRRDFINGLHQLAEYLTANPDVPVPGIQTDILLTVSDAEDGGVTEVLDLSILLKARTPSGTAFTALAGASVP